MPQQNGVVERKNRTLIEMSRTMLLENELPKYFWVEAVNTTCYVLNRVSMRPIIKRTPYELFKHNKPNISYFHLFGCKCFILNNEKYQLGKFDSKSYEGIFIGYSSQSKAYRVFNKRTLVIEESIHIVFDENPRISNHDDDLEVIPNKMNQIQINEEEDQSNIQNLENQKEVSFPRERNYVKENEIIGDPRKGVSTRSSLRVNNNLALISQIEPKNVQEALNDDGWAKAMQDELNQFEKNEVCCLVPKPSNHPIIGKKWVFRNKFDEIGRASCRERVSTIV